MEKIHIESRNRLYRPWLFFTFTFAWSWLFLIPAGVLGLGVDDFSVTILRVLAGIGPMFSAIILLYTSSGTEGSRDYWQRLISPERIRPLWWIVALLTPLVFMILTGWIDSHFGGIGIRLEETANEIRNSFEFIQFTLFILLFGPLPEEMGWRGYALDGLQARWNALSSSLFLGAAWALWHLPLFFIQGTYQAEKGIFTTSFWIFMLVMIPMSILITWVYNNTYRSTLSAVVFHFSINLTGEILHLSPRGELIDFGLWVITAVVVVCIWGPKRLVRMAS
jgi:membrane protease YdiL (CAAX protease family)